MRPFNLRVNFGLQMLSELDDGALSGILPSLMQVESYPCVYQQVHRYQTSASYVEPLIARNYFPEALPQAWHKNARVPINVRTSTQYEDPSLRKKLIKRVVRNGRHHFHFQIIDAYAGKVLLEIDMGEKQPTKQWLENAKADDLLKEHAEKLQNAKAGKALS
jgi:hypothetical protein